MSLPIFRKAAINYFLLILHFSLFWHLPTLNPQRLYFSHTVKLWLWVPFLCLINLAWLLPPKSSFICGHSTGFISSSLRAARMTRICQWSILITLLRRPCKKNVRQPWRLTDRPKTTNYLLYPIFAFWWLSFRLS